MVDDCKIPEKTLQITLEFLKFSFKTLQIILIL